MFFVRNDKYEGKPIYWIEEEIELEWQKTSSRSHAESAEYQVSGNIADSMADSMEGLRPDVQSSPLLEANWMGQGYLSLNSWLLKIINHQIIHWSIQKVESREEFYKKTFLKIIRQKFHPFLIHL